MARSAPIPSRNVEFDPSQLKVLNSGDRDALLSRYNERLQIATYAPSLQQDSKFRVATVVYVSHDNSFMRILSVARIGDSERWTVTQNVTLSLEGPEEPTPPTRSAIMDVTTSSGHQFMLTEFQPMSMETFSSRYGRTFTPAG